MKYQKWLLISLSALLYSLPFFFSATLWWVTFIFLVPLYWSALNYSLSFKEGYIWGVIQLTLHLSGVLYSIILMAEGPYIYRLIPALFIIIYEALYSGLVFWLLSLIIRFTRPSFLCTLGLWVVGMWLYFYWMDQYCLWLFGICEGYFFMHPLLPLATHACLLALLPALGKVLLTLILCSTSALLTLCFFFISLVQRGILLVCALAPWVFSCSTPHATASTAPAWLSRIAYLPGRFYYPSDLTPMGCIIAQYSAALIKKYPALDVILLPEGSISPCNLIEVPELAAFWDNKSLGKPISLIIGGTRWDGTLRFNTLYWVYNGAIKTWFDKRHGMLLTERLAPAWDCTFFRTLYFQDSAPLTLSTQSRPSWEILPDLFVVPYICSEIFFNEQQDDTYTNMPILALCNDFWLQLSYVSRLMYLVARFKALQWQRPIIYVSFYFGVYIDKYGNEWKINTL